MDEYQKREFTRARNIFTHIADRWPDDGPARVYVERCGVYLEAPPPPDWDGSFKMTHK